MTMIPPDVAADPVTAAVMPAAPAPAREALRYLSASVAALALDSVLLWFFAGRLALPVWLAGACAYGSGLVLIYLLSIRWVFRLRAVHNPRLEFAMFALLGLVGLALNSAVLTVATAAGLALPIAKFLSAGIGFVANFVSRKALLFKAART